MSLCVIWWIIFIHVSIHLFICLFYTIMEQFTIPRLWFMWLSIDCFELLNIRLIYNPFTEIETLLFGGNIRNWLNWKLSQNETFRCGQWRIFRWNDESNHQPHHCLLNHSFGCRSKKTIKLRVTGHLCGEFTGDRWIPRTNGHWRGKCFRLMTSSCIHSITHRFTPFAPLVSS